MDEALKSVQTLIEMFEKTMSKVKNSADLKTTHNKVVKLKEIEKSIEDYNRME